MSDELSPAAQFAAAAAQAAQAEAEAQSLFVSAVPAAVEAADNATDEDDASALPVVVPDTVSAWPATASAINVDDSAALDGASAQDDAISNDKATEHSSPDIADAVITEDNVAEPAAIANMFINSNVADFTVPTAISNVFVDDGHVSAAAAFENATAVDSAVASTSGDHDDADINEAPKVVTKAPRKPIDLADEELFPSLGSPAAATTSVSWGAKSSASAASAQSMAHQLKQNQATEVVDLPMMQDPVGDIARKIMETTKTRIEISHNRVLNTSTYLISGKPDAVARAKREICTKLSPRVTKVVQVPAMARAQIVGVRGKTLAGIQTQTGTSVTLGKYSDSGSADLFEQIDVSITGSHMGVAAAVAQIEAIVDKRTTKRAVKLAELPREANAMLVGKGGETLKALQATHPGVQIRIPGPIDTDQAIGVLGERDAVQAAVAEITETARLLMQGSQTVTVSIPKRQHRFIVGDGGSTLRDIIEATGCSISVPAPRNPSDQVTVRGPESNLVQALGLVMTKANSVVVQVVDPTTIHSYPRPLLYAQRVLQYLGERNRFLRIESEHGVQLRVPSNAQAQAATSPAQVQIEVQGKDAHAVAAASQALIALLQAFPPYHFNGMDVEPHLHALLAGPDGSNLTRLHSVRCVYTLFPRDSASSAILVVYEGFNPDVDRITDPAERERATRDLLRKTLEEFRTTVQSDDTYVTKVAAVPVKLQTVLAEPAALKSIMENAKATGDGVGRVVVRFGSVAPSATEPENTRFERKKHEAQLQPDEVEVKGLATAVDRVIAEICRRVDAAAEYEKLHSFRSEVTVPQVLLARVIGRGGENLKRMQTEHNVSIDVSDSTGGATGSVKIQGTETDVNAVRSEILEFAEKMADQTSEIVSVAANIHRSLIGTGGRFVKRLEEKYAVQIKFPSSRSRSDKHDDEDSGAPLAADQIRIRGGRKGVEGSKAELLELAAYELEHNHTVKFKVPAAALPHIVGRAGSHINEIKDESETRIDLGEPTDGEVEVTLIGTRAGTKLAREAIEATVLEQESQVDITIEVPTKHHRFLIGAGGGRVRELVQQAGGDPDLMTGTGACRVQFPRASSESIGEVKLKGDRAIVDAVRARIEKLVEERERMVTILVPVPVSQHAFVIGRGGANLKQMQEVHSVEIFFPRAANRNAPTAAVAETENSADVRITGLPENCEACKVALLKLVREESTITVPLALHQRLGGRQGSLWRQVRSDYDVQVDATRVDKAPVRRVDQSATVTDPENAAPGTVVYRDIDSELSGLTADWILRGEKSKLADAIAVVQKHVGGEGGVEARVSVDPRSHRHIIGKQGANIAKIRDMTGCVVTVPRKGNSSHWVTVAGERAAIAMALDFISQLIEERD